MVNLKELKNELDEIEKELNMSFEETIIDCLKEAEERSYFPFEEFSKEKLQKDTVKYTVEHYDSIRVALIKRANEIQKTLDKAQSLQHALNMVQQIVISPTVKTVVERQTRKNYILIEKHYEKSNEYNVFDWLADADPENSLGFL